MQPGVVVVGSGHAGVQLADSLRECGYDRSVTLIDQSIWRPYQRPPLSKEFLAETATPDDMVPLRGYQFFESAHVTLLGGQAVVGVDRDRQFVRLDDGSELAYDQLVFATGARARSLTLDGAELSGVTVLRTLDDALQMQNRLATATGLIVIGAGFVGLEVAAVARKRGLPVVVLEAGARPMARGLTPFMSSWFAEAVAGLGIDLRCEVDVARLTGRDGAVTGVELADGTLLSADMVVVGIGVIPNMELAANCGLEVANGILVDPTLATSDRSVSAIGDCARYPHPAVAGTVRLESVQNATDQARHLAARLAGGPPTAYSAVPWFWSHQGPLRLNIAGLALDGLESVVRGDVQAGKFSVFAFEGAVLRCVESMNSPGDHIAARKILAAGTLPSPQQVADPAFDLKAFSRAYA